MQVEIGVGLRVDLRDEPVGKLLAGGAVRPAGEHAVQVLAVLRHDVDAAGPKSLDVEDRQHEQRAPDVLRIEPEKPQRGLDRAEFRAVHARRDEEAGAGLRPFQQPERDFEALDGVAETLLLAGAAGAEFGEVGHGQTLGSACRPGTTLSPRAQARQ